MKFGRRNLHLLLLKMFSKKVGDNLNFHYGVIFHATNKTTFGNNIDIGNGSLLSMGGCECMIGNNVMIGTDVKLITIEHGYKDRNIPMQKQTSTYSPIIIEEDVWLGDGVKVISGSKPLKISKGIIVGAGSIVTKNLSVEYGIYIGSPAKFLKSRFD
jgi:acetyltransferase-like isoleucine patch superfamily enzyme